MRRTPKDLGELGNGEEVMREARIMIAARGSRPETIQVIQTWAFEVAGKDTGVQLGGANTIERVLDSVADEEFTFNGVTAKVSDIRGLLSEAIDAWRAEDEQA